MTGGAFLTIVSMLLMAQAAAGISPTTIHCVSAHPETTDIEILIKPETNLTFSPSIVISRNKQVHTQLLVPISVVRGQPGTRLAGINIYSTGEFGTENNLRVYLQKDIFTGKILGPGSIICNREEIYLRCSGS